MGSQETPLLGRALTLYLLNCREGLKAAEALEGGRTAIIYQSMESFSLLVNNMNLKVPT